MFLMTMMSWRPSYKEHFTQQSYYVFSKIRASCKENFTQVDLFSIEFFMFEAANLILKFGAGQVSFKGEPFPDLKTIHFVEVICNPCTSFRDY